MEELESENYRGFCRFIIQEMKQIDQNLATGNFKKTCVTTLMKNASDVKISDDCIGPYSKFVDEGGRVRPPNEPESNKFSKNNR